MANLRRDVPVAAGEGRPNTGSLPRVGFVGLGAMGRPMALNLLHAGYPVVVMNRSPGAVEELVAKGAVAGTTLEELGASADIVVTMLPGPTEVLEVVLGGRGSKGVLAGLRPGGLLVDMSTIAPAVSRELSRTCDSTGVLCVDAPVSGGEAGARDGRLAIMVGGDGEAVRRARPLLEVLGQKVVHVGSAGSGQVVKLANQVIVGGTIALVAEALALAGKGGVSGEAVISALEGGFADSAILRNHGKRMLAEQFQPGFRLTLQLKDLELALSLASEEGITLEVGAVVCAVVRRAVEEGYGALDHAAVSRVLGRGNGEPC